MNRIQINNQIYKEKYDKHANDKSIFFQKKHEIMKSKEIIKEYEFNKYYQDVQPNYIKDKWTDFVNILWEFDSYANDYTDLAVKNHDQTPTIPSPIFFFHSPDFDFGSVPVYLNPIPTEPRDYETPTLSSPLTRSTQTPLPCSFLCARDQIPFLTPWCALPDFPLFLYSISPVFSFLSTPDHTSGSSSPNGDLLPPASQSTPDDEFLFDSHTAASPLAHELVTQQHHSTDLKSISHPTPKSPLMP
jgi:hypothetical protein